MEGCEFLSLFSLPAVVSSIAEGLKPGCCHLFSVWLSYLSIFCVSISCLSVSLSLSNLSVPKYKVLPLVSPFIHPLISGICSKWTGGIKPWVILPAETSSFNWEAWSWCLWNVATAFLVSYWLGHLLIHWLCQVHCVNCLQRCCNCPCL